MSGKAFVMLLRKDLRVFRGPIIGLVVVTAMVYGVGLSAAIWASREEFSVGLRVRNMLEDAGFAGMALVTLLATTFGGMAFASERRDRSADFLALLPTSRSASAASKLLAAVALLSAAFALHMVMAAVGSHARDSVYNAGRGPGFLHTDGGAVAALAAAMAMGFGIAWGLSSVLTSAAVSACIGGVCPLGSCVLLRYVADAREWPTATFDHWWFTLALSCAAVGLMAGTAVYLRRIEP